MGLWRTDYIEFGESAGVDRIRIQSPPERPKCPCPERGLISLTVSIVRLP